MLYFINEIIYFYCQKTLNGQPFGAGAFFSSPVGKWPASSWGHLPAAFSRPNWPFFPPSFGGKFSF